MPFPMLHNLLLESSKISPKYPLIMLDPLPIGCQVAFGLFKSKYCNGVLFPMVHKTPLESSVILPPWPLVMLEPSAACQVAWVSVKSSDWRPDPDPMLHRVRWESSKKTPAQPLDILEFFASGAHSFPPVVEYCRGVSRPMAHRV